MPNNLENCSAFLALKKLSLQLVLNHQFSIHL